MEQKTERHLHEAATPAIVVQNLNELARIFCSEYEGRSHVDDLYAALRQYNS